MKDFMRELFIETPVGILIVLVIAAAVVGCWCGYWHYTSEIEHVRAGLAYQTPGDPMAIAGWVRVK